MSVRSCLGAVALGVLLPLASPVGAGAAREPVPLQRRVTAFVGVGVVPMDRDTLLADQTVVVRDGRIVALGPRTDITVPPDARQLDGRGKYLLPGLCDMHVHLRFLKQANDNPAMLELFVVSGVTTVLNLLGLPEHLVLRDSIARGGVLAPVVYTSGFYLNPPYVTTPAQMDSAVVAQKRAGYDVLKLHGDLEPESYRQLLKSAHREGLRLIGHAPRNLGFEAMVAGRQDVIAHAEEFLHALILFKRSPPTTLAEIDSMLHYAGAATAKAGIWLMPTLTCFRNISSQIDNLDTVLARPAIRVVPRGIAADWRRDRNPYVGNPPEAAEQFRRGYFILARLTRMFHEHGVRMLAGTDTPVSATPPGSSLHDELANLVEAGLTPYQALRMATADAADFLSAADRFGTVAAGRRADLVLLDANPLADIHATTRIAGVMVRGRWLSGTEIRSKLQFLEAQSTR